MSSAKGRLFSLGLNELNDYISGFNPEYTSGSSQLQLKLWYGWSIMHPDFKWGDYLSLKQLLFKLIH